MNNTNLIDEKVDKREKKDIMLSYILIVILVCCISFVLSIKFLFGDTVSDDTDDDYSENHISLSQLATSVNDKLNTKYAGISVLSSGSGINIEYGDITYTASLINNNELEYTIDSDNKDLSEDVYKELVASVCTYYYEDRDGCILAAKKLDSNTSGIRFVGDDKVYIDIVNSVKPISSPSSMAEGMTTDNYQSVNNEDSKDESATDNFFIVE